MFFFVFFCACKVFFLKKNKEFKTGLITSLYYTSTAKTKKTKYFQHCNYLEEMLNYIRALAPNDVKGKILEDWFKF